MNILFELRSLLNDPQLIINEQLQLLWSGYGQIIRCTNKQKGLSYIVKVVAPDKAYTHPRGWNTSTSHIRKLKSYQIEASFYQQYAPLTDDFTKVPKLIASKTLENYTLLVMEDLDDTGYFVRFEDANWQALTLAIRWLAYFHIRFMGIKGDKLWPTGCYWHLATRQDELQAMPDSDYKQHAQQIDTTLNNAKFKTLLHGDAKFANLCFHHNGQNVAAVDFQYVGCGSGVKDLAYLVGSCMNDELLFQYEKQILTEYLSQLKQAIDYYQAPVNYSALADEINYLYPIAWADFYRFLLGWNPQSWKIGDYMTYKAQQGLTQLTLS